MNYKNYSSTKFNPVLVEALPVLEPMAVMLLALVVMKGEFNVVSLPADIRKVPQASVAAADTA